MKLPFNELFFRTMTFIINHVLILFNEFFYIKRIFFYSQWPLLTKNFGVLLSVYLLFNLTCYIVIFVLSVLSLRITSIAIEITVFL